MTEERKTELLEKMASYLYDHGLVEDFFEEWEELDEEEKRYLFPEMEDEEEEW